jgi:hypothetical protein
MVVRTYQALAIQLNWGAAVLRPYKELAQTKIAAETTSSPDESLSSSITGAVCKLLS